MLPRSIWEPAAAHLGLGSYHDLLNMMSSAAPPKPPDLTPRQIEWCRAHIPMFAEMQRLRGVK